MLKMFNGILKVNHLSTWSGFKEWIMDVLEEGSMLVYYKENEKELNI